MQLPPGDEIVMVAGMHPVRARKARYFKDRRFNERILPPPETTAAVEPRPDDWTSLPTPTRELAQTASAAPPTNKNEDTANGGIRREPGLEPHKDIVPEARPMEDEFQLDREDEDADAVRARTLARMRRLARGISLDPGDDMEM
jgi:type IV secretion system protein VirD4